MQSPDDDTTEGQLAALERYLDELERKTLSNFMVTNPTTGVKNLEVGPTGSTYHVRLRDSNGNILYGNRDGGGVAGFRTPLPMYPARPFSGYIYDSDTNWIDIWQTRSVINSQGLSVQYRYADLNQAGGSLEARMQYDIGGGRVTIASSLVTGAVNPTNSTKSFTFTWPGDQMGVEATLALQTRMASGTGQAAASPVYILGV
jgi:hypothetical protein